MEVVNVITAPQYVIRSGTITRLREIWPALAQSNPDLLNAIIATTASNQALRDAEFIYTDPQDLLQEMYLTPHTTDYLFHQAKAIQFINDKLSDPAEATLHFQLKQ